MIHEFDPQIYPRKIWVAIGEPHETIERHFEDVPPMGKNDDASVVNTRNLEGPVRGGILIRFESIQAVTSSIITHEATHAAMEIFDFIGAFPDLKNQEPFSYLCGWIAGCINEALSYEKSKPK